MPRILIVDDDPSIVTLLSKSLIHRGYETETAADGAEGLAKLEASPPDLVISDAMMPHLDGWKLLEAIRARPEFLHIPVIMLTALGSTDHRTRGFDLGADDYIPKPFKMEEIELRVKQALKHRAHLVYFTQSLRKAGATAAGPSMQGDVGEFGIGTLLCLCELEKKTGTFVVSRADSTCVKVRFRDGRVVGAIAEGAAIEPGRLAFEALLRWRDGRFEFHRGEATDDDAMNASPSELIAQASRASMRPPPRAT